MRKHNYIICYDISILEIDDIKGSKRLATVAKYLESIAFRVQYSVFLLSDMTKQELEIILAKLQNIINHSEDDLRIYRIKRSGYKLGLGVDLDEPFIIL